MVRCMESLLYDIASRFLYNYVIVHSNEYTHTNARTCGMMRSSLTYIRFSVLTPRSSGNSGTSDWRTCAATMGAGWVCASWQKAPSCDLEEITLSGGQGTRKQKCNPDNSRPLLPTARARCALAPIHPSPHTSSINFRISNPFEICPGPILNGLVVAGVGGGKCV